MQLLSRTSFCLDIGSKESLGTTVEALILEDSDPEKTSREEYGWHKKPLQGVLCGCTREI